MAIGLMTTGNYRAI